MPQLTTTEIIIGILVIIVIFLIYQNGIWPFKSTPAPEPSDANSILNKLEQSGAIAATPADPEPADNPNAE